MSDSPEQIIKAPIPKFASFRPRAKLESAKDEEATQTKLREERRESRSGDRKYHSHRHHHHRRGRNRETSRTDCEDDIGDTRSLDTGKDKGASEVTPEIYVIDKKGDIHNITYGTLHRYSIPVYYRAGHGQVLGLPTGYRIDRDVSEQQVLYIKHRNEQGDAGKNKLYPKRYREPPARILRIKPNPQYDPNVDVWKDFIALSSHGSRKRRRVDKDHRLNSDEESHNYRSIEGKAKAPNTIDEDLDIMSESSDSDGYAFHEPTHSNKQQRIHLSRDVESRPSDVDAWIALIDHQGFYMDGDNSTKDSLTSAEKRSLADLKISVYEKALEKVHDREGKERLLSGLMEEGSSIWETRKLAAKWRSLLQEYPSFIGLWVKYLDFQQTNFLGFTYEACRSSFVDCLSMLSSDRNYSGEIERIQVYVLLRLTLLMREAGFIEHATAIWQAVLELNFFRLEGASNDPITLRASFEEFWESEVARIGEENAKGWRNSTNDPVESTTDVSTKSLDDSDIFRSWTECEADRIVRSRQPARTLDDVEEDDPYRVILFSDIRDFLILFNAPKSREFLIHALLAFCSLPPYQTDDLESHAHWRDPFVRNDFLSQSGDSETGWFPKDSRHSIRGLFVLDDHNVDAEEVSDGARRSPLLYPMQSFVPSADTLFADKQSWFRTFTPWDELFPGNTGPVDLDWMRRVLKALVDIEETDDSLAAYYLGLEWANDAKRARKSAKALLKKRPLSLLLYNAYALIEERSGNSTAADKVWSTATAMMNSFEKDSIDGSILLWRTWIKEMLAKADTSKALRLLLAIPARSVDLERNDQIDTGDVQLNATELLRARRFLTSGQEHAFSLRHWHHGVYYTECLAILAYLSQECDIEQCLEILRSATKVIDRAGVQNSSSREELHQSKARLLYHHMTTVKHYKPSLIRTELEESIKLFPNNTIFLSLYFWLESRSRIDDRVRSIVRSSAFAKTTKDSAIGHFFSVYTELQRSVSSGSTVHSVRAAFERAVDHPSGKASAALWKLFVLFELRYGDPARAKDVFYRGMRAVPWAKPFMMLAFTHMRDAMTFEELRKVYNVLGEKELRVHVDLEDAFERHDERAKHGRVESMGARVAIELPHDASSEEEE